MDFIDALSGYEPYLSLVVAVAAGLIIGFEREQASPPDEDPQRRLSAGARTIPLISLAGALSVLLSRLVGMVLVVAVLVAVAAFLFVPYALDTKRAKDRGVTTESAALIAYLLGVLAPSHEVIPSLGQRLVLVMGLAVIVTVLLSTKTELHGVAQRLSRQDVFATLKFLVLVVIVLPLLPNTTVGPLDVLNPFEAGLMVVLIAGIGFVAFLAIRILGPRRGLGLTGIVGGMVSSTAVTLTFSGRAKTSPHLHRASALAVVLASTIMFPRVLLEVSVVNDALLPMVTWPLLLMTAAGLLLSLALTRGRPAASQSAEDHPEVDYPNPFELSTALKFGALFVVILFGSKFAVTTFGSGGVYLAALLGGTTDVDAITLSLAKLATQGVDPQKAGIGIILGCASNTLVKAGIAVALGGWHFGRLVLISFVACLMTGAVGVVGVVAIF
jgi:uncharacterized membrane protein (DUF4010 family)